MAILPDLERQLAAADTMPARIDALNALALAHVQAGDAQRAMPFAREAERLAIEANDDRRRSLALCHIGMSDYLLADYSAGLESCLQAMVLSERTRDAEAMGTALVSASACQYQMGAREESLQALYQALEVIEGAACDPLLVRVHNALGVILGDKGRYDESELHYRSALTLGARYGDVIYAARVKMNFAGLYLDRGRRIGHDGKPDEARQQYLEGLSLCEGLLGGPGLDSAFNKAHCSGMMGELRLALGQTLLARDLFAEMLAHGTAMKNPHQQAEALMNLGKAHMALGDTAEARGHLERALDLAAGANVRRLRADGFLSLAAWFEASGDFRQALEYHKRFHVLREELLREEVHAAGVAHELWLKFQRARRELRNHQEQVDRLTRDAHEDSLTGLANRRYLDRRLAELVASACERGLRMCVGIVDVDHFKAINDGHSHAVGDTVLRTVAAMIGAHCREGDVSARYGGDEFVLCLIGARLESAAAGLERLRNLVADYPWGDVHTDLRVTLSIGVAEVESGETVAALMQRVDAALYRAKRAGRNCVIGDAVGGDVAALPLRSAMSSSP
jgi:diguanylate cyclase (GGDEF)-like protein